MPMLPKRGKHTLGQADHVDAWVISYADMITLLFACFMVFVSFSATTHTTGSNAVSQGEPEHPVIEERYGALALKTPYDNVYRNMMGIIDANGAEASVAVIQTSKGLWIDISALPFFEGDSAVVSPGQLPLLEQIAAALQDSALDGYMIEVEGHVGNEALQNSEYANAWELTGMRASRVVGLLVNAGIDPSRLRATSYAAAKPLVPNTDSKGQPIVENRQRNQRIIIKAERNVVRSSFN